jgi:hypothetical protein
MLTHKLKSSVPLSSGEGLGVRLIIGKIDLATLNLTSRASSPEERR